MEIKFEYDDHAELNEREKTTLEAMEYLCFGLKFREIKQVLGTFLTRTDDAGFYPHWLEQAGTKDEFATALADKICEHIAKTMESAQEE